MLWGEDNINKMIMNQDEQEVRPETSKCSRLEKRRLVSQNHSRQESNAQPVRPKIAGITLDQYFRGTHFKVIEINEDDWDHDNQILPPDAQQLNAPRIPPLQNTNFRIKTGKKRQDTLSKQKLLERSPMQQQTGGVRRQMAKARQPHVTSNEFFNQDEERMRRTHMELKYGKLKDEIVNRFSNQDQELLNKYAEKFNIYSSNPPRLSLAPRDLQTKIK